MKKEQVQQQTQQQNQNQNQQIQTQQQNQNQIYFITFTHKIDREKARRVIAELRRYYGGIAIFTRRPPAGRKVIHNINDVVVIITFPYIRSNDQEKKEQCSTQVQEGFKLRELLRKV